MRILKRLWKPTLTFLFFLGVVLLGDGFTPFKSGALSQTQKVISYAFQVGIWLSAAYLLNRLLSLFFWDTVVAGILGGSTPRLLKDVTGFLLYVIAITGIIGVVFDRSVTGIWATSGAIGLVIGFALRSIILDVFTGLAVNIDRPYRIGDWIMLHGKRPEMHIIGQVNEINWRTTRISTKDGNVLIVPNSIMGQSLVTNFMQPRLQNRHEVVFCLDFSVSPDQAIRIIHAATKAVCGTKNGPLEKPAPKVRILWTTKVGVEYRVRYWLIPKDTSPNKARHTVTKSVLEHLQQAGLTLAYPKQDIYHEKMPVRQLDSRSVDDRKRILSRVELFAQLQESELAQLAEGMQQHFYDAQDTMIQRGEDGTSMFIIVEGLLEVFASSGEGDEEIKVAQMVPGQFLGEMSLLTGEPRSATIRTATETVVYEITKDQVNELLQSRPEIAEVLSETIAARNLRSLKAKESLSQEEKDEQQSNFSQQIMGKMRAFFGGVFGSSDEAEEK